ncbi:MAG: chorismate-binding protein, partial [Myxococcales bacterium]|nr:chorismate-binding protein [Myxococcales bacterium]
MSAGASGSSGASGSHPPFDVAVLSRSLERCPDPVALYAALCHGRPDTALLESADHSTASGSQSLLMSRAALRIVGRGRRVTLDALSANGRDLLAGLARRHPEATASDTGERLVLDYPPPATGDERARLLAPSPLDAVREAVLSLRVTGAIAPRPPLAIGAFAYDLLGVYEALPEPASDPLAWPDFELWVAEEVVAIEHDKHRATALRFVFGGITPPQNSPAYHDASRALAELVTRIETIPAAPPPGEPPRLPPELGAEVDQDDAAYCATVTTLKEHIRRGDIFQIVPSRSFRRPCPDALAAYAELRALNPSPYMFFLHGSAGQLFGASPESALTVRGPARRLRINPIAGTRPRG